MDPTGIPDQFRLTLNEPAARRWLAHAIAHREGIAPGYQILGASQATRLEFLEQLCEEEGGRIGPDRAGELDHLRALREIDELRDEHPPEGRLSALQPQVEMNYNPRYTDEADTTDELVSYACEAGLFGSGAHVDFAFHYHFGGDCGYWWHITLVAGEQKLDLASQFYELDVLCGEHERGLEAAMSVLKEAERSANEVIENLPRFLAAPDRKSCSCGEAWSDEPGHDDGENSRD